MRTNIKSKCVFLIALVLCVLCKNNAVAQDCDALVRPLFAETPQVYNNLPQQKINYYCTFAQNAFYWANTLPQNAFVYNISNVKNKISGEYLSQNIDIDLNTFSYFAYNFEDFQYQHYYNEIYFKVGNGPNVKYLVLRHYNDIVNRCLIWERSISTEDNHSSNRQER